MRKRGFEVCASFKDLNIHLPIRSTKHAAGYDFEAASDVEIPSIWTTGIKVGWSAVRAFAAAGKTEQTVKPTLVATGIKAYMGNDEYLQLTNRSSNPLKRFLLLANGVGVIDADYYNNSDNEGHIMFQFINFGFTPVLIQKGERIGQGIFLPFLKADQDVEGTERTSGFGSTGQK